MPSFNAINYAVRPNKNVERKLIISGLLEINRLLDLSGHRYIGLGSIWFVDFMLAHRWLSIDDMVSIEKDDFGYQRAQFNRPLACIKILKGDTTALLPDIDYADKASLLWLDYDTGVSGPVLDDIAIALPKLNAGSIFIVTLSAKKDDLPKVDDVGNPIGPGQALRRIVGDLMPGDVPEKRFRKPDYPRLVGEIVGNRFKSVHLRNEREEVWVELFDIVYSDSTPMITVGGMIVPRTSAETVKSLVSSPKWRGRPLEPISLPPLTLKEKIALDRLMPSHEAPTQHAVGELGFMLLPEQIRAYHRHYKDYPIFSELIG